MCKIYNFLVVLGSLLFCLAYSKNVKIYVELGKRDDGEVAASLYVENATREIFKNSSLSVVIETVMDDSKHLISAFGNVKETNGNNAVELTCDATSKDEEIKKLQTSMEEEIKKLQTSMEEEIRKCESSKEEEIKKSLSLEEDYKRLWLSHCSEEAQELLDVFPREHVNAIQENRTQEAKFVIVDGNGHLDWFKDAVIESLPVLYRSSSLIRIHDNGSAYGIRLKEEYDYVEKGGLGSNYLLVEFQKENRDTPPSEKAIKTCKELLRTAVCSKLLSPNYYVIPFYLIGNYYSIGNESFEKNALSKWVGYKGSLDFLVTSESDGNWKWPIVSRKELILLSFTHTYDFFNISSPIEYLVVSNYGTRCLFSCKETVEALDVTSWLHRIMLDINFWVGENGGAYEYLGWGMTTQRVYQSKKAVVVAFMGHFNNYRPMKRIFDAFEVLIEEGLRLGKLSPTFKIVSISNPNANPMNSGVISNSLEEEIRKHHRFSDTF